MDDLIDEKVTMKEKRGKTLPVLVVLSFVWIAFSFGSLILQLADGPLTDEKIEEQTYEIMQTYDESMPEFYTNMIEESIATLEVVKDNFWMIIGVTAFSLVVGFFAVFMMYKLKKTGFYLYIAYCLIPLIMTAALFSDFSLSVMGMAISAGFSILFIILYGAQLKRMS
jgi:ABC-type Fe3+ transport system permease subunit